MENKGDIKKNDDKTLNKKHQNSKEPKKANNIPIKKKKNKSKRHLIERNNIFNYCKQMTNLTSPKEINNNSIWQTTNEAKFEKNLKRDNLQ